MQTIKTLGIATFGAIVALGIYVWLVPQETVIIEADPAPRAILSSTSIGGHGGAILPDFVGAARRAMPAVVFIQSVARETGFLSSRRFDASTGSGVIISVDGYIATNHHVIKDATTITVTLSDNREYEADLIGSDPSTDLALLRIDADRPLEYVDFADSDDIQIGEWVLAIGNPFRLQSTVTAGIVSAKGRKINILEKTGIESFIQTDAAVNPGNSGGALINADGGLIGINTAIMTASGGYEGFSFAVPSNLAKKVIRDIKEFGIVQRGWLGVSIIDVDDARAKDLEMPFVGGVYISSLDSKGAARAGGLRSGDVVYKVDQEETVNTPEFMEKVAQYRPGDEIELEYIRDGETRMTSVTLRNRLNSVEPLLVRKDKVLLDLGMELRDLNSDEKSRLGVTGVKVSTVYNNSTVWRVNMEPGYIITAIDGQEMSSADEVTKYLETKKGRVYIEGYYENYAGTFPYTFDVD